ncbi:SelT-like protein [Cucurbita argyrosperma subsp. argyrosperma]|nr:SelT-like protein [Cucurbita argyrosperma subsp. argyrosperma]
MDRTRIDLLGLPIFLLFTDIVNRFTPSPPKPANLPPARVHYQPKFESVIQEPIQFPTEKQSGIEGIGHWQRYQYQFLRFLFFSVSCALACPLISNFIRRYCNNDEKYAGVIISWT